MTPGMCRLECKLERADTRRQKGCGLRISLHFADSSLSRSRRCPMDVPHNWPVTRAGLGAEYDPCVGSACIGRKSVSMAFRLLTYCC